MALQFNTPILFLIFNRPDVTQKVFDQIKQIKPKNLFVAADGPRPDRPTELILCMETRQVINQVDWDCELKTLFREENLGCGVAVSSAISWFFDQVEEGIIVEDDCLPDLSFFPFCSELLTKYKDDESIYIISGTNMQNGIMRGNSSYYFSNYPAIWGWASWRRAWNLYIYDVQNIEKSFKSGELNHVFQSFREKLYWTRKLKKNLTGKKSTWDYQWSYAIWKNRGLSIIPNVNLITNIGFRNNSSHIFLEDSIREPSISHPIQFPLIHPGKNVNREADHFLYKNAVSHSISRLFRLIKENGIITIVKYTLGKIIKTNP